MSTKLAMIALLLYFLVGCPAAGSGQASSTTRARTATTQRDTGQPGIRALASTDSLVLLQRKEIEILREYDESLLNTVYWALGGVFTLAAVLLASGWWVNFRLYERDKNAIREEMLVAVRQEVRALDTGLREEARRQQDQFTEELRFLRTQVQEALPALRDDVRKEAELAATFALNPIARKLNNLDHEFTGLKIDLLEEEVESLRKRGPTLAVQKCIEWLHLSIRHGNPFNVEAALQVLIALVEGGGEFFRSELREAIEVVRRTDDESPLKARALAALDSAKLME
ncbi:hypothetical protein [Longimicrobium terrae]|uniref:HEAT repeat domain-containing protein n=1 Tax=Longimicrobium terrae TaxID=1639882 RepID=A0A841GW21_9BACT|nr:hypothetical protein [Longimicrobium terrae]MBB4634800.1 hypothetical protein [Longimicrobium terrae]MBB6069195.1 hypothetical protein [Longimicrobium terrae]NNC31993.1 hypothetical protein [Longimicrobium terrae]